MKYQGLVVVITGASSGIGAATAHRLAQRGARVVLAARNLEALTKIARDVEAAGGEALIVPTDVRDPAACAELMQRTLAQWGRIDVLINNAGLAYSNRVGQLNVDDVRTQIETNLLGVIWCCNAAVPVMLDQGRGAIINVGSVAGRIAVPTSSVYVASKFGLDGFTQALRAEVGYQGIAVSLLNPGYVATDFSRRSSRGKPQTRPRPGPVMSADYVAQAIVKLIAHPRRQMVISWPYRIATGLSRIAPSLTGWLASHIGRRLFG